MEFKKIFLIRLSLTNIFFVLGSECEKWHKKGKSLKHFPKTISNKQSNEVFMDIRENDINSFDGEKGKDIQKKRNQCGNEPFPGPGGSWALRIIGKYLLHSLEVPRSSSNGISFPVLLGRPSSNAVSCTALSTTG